MLRSLALTLGLAGLVATAATPASGHVITDKGTWLFTGSTYSDRLLAHPRKQDRSDPINVIWRGPGSAAFFIPEVQDHIEQHWRERRIPDKYPRGAFMRRRNGNPLCTSPQYVFFRRGNDENAGRWSQSEGYMSTNGLCLNQYHIRMWDSDVHSDFFGPAHYKEFVLTPIHHEHVVKKKHVIDISFDAARSAYIHTMNDAHCVDRGWRVNPESLNHNYGHQGPYSGIISRISMRHLSQGCNGA